MSKLKPASYDERELAYIDSDLHLPQPWQDEELRAEQRKIDSAMKYRGGELIENMGEERARERLKSLAAFGIQE